MEMLQTSIVTPFLSGNLNSYRILGSYSIDESAIYIHGEKTILKNKKGEIFVQLTGNIDLTINLLNSFPDIEARKRNGEILINGYEWDGKKTNLNLFINN